VSPLPFADPLSIGEAPHHFESHPKSTIAIFEVAKLCYQAKETLSPEDKRKLQEPGGLPFSKPTFVKLALIGSDKRLELIQAELPPSFTAIYEIHQLDGDQLNTAVSTKVVHPDATRAEIMNFRRSCSSKRAEPQKGGPLSSSAGRTEAHGDAMGAHTLSKTGSIDAKEYQQPAQNGSLQLAKQRSLQIEPGRLYELKIPSTTSAPDCEQISRALDSVIGLFGVEVVPITDLPSTDAELIPAEPVTANSSVKRSSRLNAQLKGSTSISPSLLE
jgi:hypothetical protein